ncbi:minichromosome maintenance 5 protein [Artemisia annua]|uniref:DNA helicase n=1 Tax=Artemisia annua TaxID=35608 RepID=A0A2U1M863_ARTAN|nr:minichromosome maintenance 5 protein [Artemisia annua]
MNQDSKNKCRRYNIEVDRMTEQELRTAHHLPILTHAPYAVLVVEYVSPTLLIVQAETEDGSDEFLTFVHRKLYASLTLLIVEEETEDGSDEVAIHEAMEHQTMYIAKAGITVVLNSRTVVLAAANPPSGRYGDLKTTEDNIDLQTTILSRFDLIFIVKGIRMFKVYASANAANDPRDTKDDNWLKRYIQYCRIMIRPRLSKNADKSLQKTYVKVRQVWYTYEFQRKDWFRGVDCGLKNNSLFVNEDSGLRGDYDDMQLIRNQPRFCQFSSNVSMFKDVRCDVLNADTLLENWPRYWPRSIAPQASPERCLGIAPDTMTNSLIQDQGTCSCKEIHGLCVSCNRGAYSVRQKALISGTVFFTKERCEIKENGVSSNLVQITFSHYPLLFPIYPWKLHSIIDQGLLLN